MRDATWHPAPIDLDAFACEPDGEATVVVAAHLERCADCRRRVTDARAVDAGLRERLPALPLARPSRAPRRRWYAGAAAGLLAAGLLVAFGLRPDDRPIDASAPVRAKGVARLELMLQRDGLTTPFSGGATHPGDVLAFRYTAEYPYLIVLLIEATGNVDVAVDDDGHSLRVEPGVGRAAPEGVELDGYQGPQLVMGLLSREPLSSHDVAEAARRAWESLPPAERGALRIGPLPVDAQQFTWHLTTRPR